MRDRYNRAVSLVAVCLSFCAMSFVVAQDPKPAPIATPRDRQFLAPAKDMVKGPVNPPRPTPLPKKAVEVIRREVQAIQNKQEQVFVRLQRVAVPDPAPGPVEVVVEGVVLNANMKAMLPQWVTQLRPTLRSEYQFLRTVCEPTKDQRRPIIRAGERALQRAAAEFVNMQFGGNRVVQIAGVWRNNQVDPRKTIQDGLTTAAKLSLTPQQWQRYESELESRNAEEKRTSVLSIVAFLDRSLFLAADQRERLTDSLVKNWDPSWGNSSAMLEQENAYFPMIPDNLITPFLNDAQKTVWNGSQKVTYSTVSGINGGVFRDGPLDDELPEESAKPAEQVDEFVKVFMAGVVKKGAKPAVPAPVPPLAPVRIAPVGIVNGFVEAFKGFAPVKNPQKREAVPVRGPQAAPAPPKPPDSAPAPARLDASPFVKAFQGKAARASVNDEKK